MRTAQLRPMIALAIATLALLAAGCGGGKAKTSTSGAGGAEPPANVTSAAYKFSRCMRQHGVSSFPDPQVVNSAGQHGISIHITPAITGSPDFTPAQKACAGIMPAPSNANAGPSPQQEAAHLKGVVGFATCMRNHHVSNFPDPNAQGDLTEEMLTAAGINVHAPAVDAAASACVSASDGQITAADVAHAETGGPANGG
jgi:hypothetical protein